ncbi:MAG: DMT family transporter [Rhodospirillaceae bacterium]|jgi:drug/metabolite transporter (DMT)-like permease|nr:DMT family transporter [Rhodospirillaceae bacterium]MBT3492201.1 DMT family transporter [Rhodospirillaceae bacterium]MBT3778548.1 DMT family transporter [Rhodospirillaceae bacterium]MBT3977546.1 DMT family transporter [Rhodospirillaceae bacterium]MBT4171185.1 DMT family transporter [Rhodospirillaceae bacterium]
MEQQSVPRGIFYVVLSAMVLVPMVSASIKHLGHSYGVLEIVWVRALGQTVWMIALLAPRHGWRILLPRRPGIQLLRSGLLFIATLCFILGIKAVPLVTVHVIGFTAPMIVVALSAILLHERVGAARWVAVGGGFLGVLIVLQPGTGNALPPAALWLLLAAVSWSVVQILSRQVAAHDRSETTAIYTYAVALLATTPFVPVYFDFSISPGPGGWLAFLLIGLVGGIRHYCIIKAYALAPASLIAPFNYTELLGATLVGVIVFGTLPNGATWLGAGVIIAAGLYLAHRERSVGP